MEDKIEKKITTIINLVNVKQVSLKNV